MGVIVDAIANTPPVISVLPVWDFVWGVGSTIVVVLAHGFLVGDLHGIHDTIRSVTYWRVRRAKPDYPIFLFRRFPDLRLTYCERANTPERVGGCTSIISQAIRIEFHSGFHNGRIVYILDTLSGLTVRISRAA